MDSLEELINGPIYSAYSYSYPHKTAYRTLDEPVALNPLWQTENLDSLFLYVHVPFCEMRCGFCNLFTLVRPHESLPDLYLDALERQIKALAPTLSDAKFARYAIGGGTPTYLSSAQLERLFDLTFFNGMADNMPLGIETSPETATKEKIQLLQSRGVNRISMGVQSFTAGEARALARRQDNGQVFKAIETIRTHSTADLNLDLIYGIAGQTIESWLLSLQQALICKPEELYLYPLYVRNETGLGKVKDKTHIATDLDDVDMLALYREGRAFLLAEGYEQISMRMFRRRGLTNGLELPTYSCQEDGMLGLGAGARSYTQSVHYSSEYAVGRYGVKDIIEHYVDQSETDFLLAGYGVKLSLDEQKRRFVMQSLLISDGLDLSAYQRRFHSNCLTDFPQLELLINAGLAYQQGNLILLSVMGFERADSIGPWFSSDSVKSRMGEYHGK
jgi:oxygen-independent coproporphyrinogen-3 oxidase